MKLISRKAAIAAITAIAVSAGSLSAPAFAQNSPEKPASPAVAATKTEAPKKDGSSDKNSSSDNKANGSSSELSSDADKRKDFVSNLKEWLTLLTTVGSLLAAIYTIGTNFERLAKQNSR